VDWYEFTDVSEVCNASIIALMTEAAQTPETSVNSRQSTRRYNSKTTIFKNSRL
jgi:hypothetical protein